MDSFNKRLLLFFVSIGMFILFQNFAKINSDSIAQMQETKNISKDDLVERSIDLKLFSLQKDTANSYLASKCYETRVTCFANRNHEKCLNDKVKQFLRCTKIKSTVAAITSQAVIQKF